MVRLRGNGATRGALCAAAALGAILAASSVALGAVTPQIQANPALTSKPAVAVSLEGTPYSFTGKCGAGDQYLLVRLHVANTGSAPSPAVTDTRVLWVAEQTNSTWAGGVALPAIDPGKSVSTTVGIPARSPASSMSGTHTFVVTLNGKPWFAESSTLNHTLNVPVTGGPRCAFVAGTAAVSPVTASHATISSGITTTAVQPKPLVLNPKAVILNGPTIASPSNFWYTNDPTVCVNHAALLASLVCPGVLADGTTLLLVWDWNANSCTSGNCVSSIDGFHIYRVSPGYTAGQYVVLPSRTLIDTQSDPSYTLRGIKPFSTGQCFVATAFKGKDESPDSWSYCVPANLALGTQEVTYSPAAGQTRAAFDVACAHPNTYDAPYTVLGGPEAGTMAFQNGQNGCQGNQNYQGLFAYDLRYRHKAQRALLQIQSVNGTYCATKIALTQRYWPDVNPTRRDATQFEGVNAAMQWDLPSPENGVISVDVSPYYNGWVGSRVGFAFIAPAPDWGQFQPPSCLSNYTVNFDVTEYK